MKFVGQVLKLHLRSSLPARGAWIEILYISHLFRMESSLPARGAWIEITMCTPAPSMRKRRSPHGERGLKFWRKIAPAIRVFCRSPHGERGLKYLPLPRKQGVCRSLPARGAWIEIGLLYTKSNTQTSLPARGAWIEMPYNHTRQYLCHSRSPHGERGLKYMPWDMIYLPVLRSLPARGAWIEMRPYQYLSNSCPESLPARGAWIEIEPLRGR